MKTKTETRREAILVAAKAVFEEVGFEQATMSEITTRVGGSKATLYRYFDSKESLFLELVRRTARQHGGELTALLDPCFVKSAESTLPPEALKVLALLDPDQEVATALKGFGERVLKTFHTPQKLAIRRMVIAAAAHNPEVGRLFYENGPAQGMKQVERYFVGVMKAGKLRQADPKAAAAHFRGLLESEVEEPGLFNARAELDDELIAAVVQRAVDVFMRAYGPVAA